MNDIRDNGHNGRMRILLLTDRYAPSLGGVERQCAILAAEFGRLGCDVTIVTDRYSFSLPAFEMEDQTAVYRLLSLSFMRRFMGTYVASLKRKGVIERRGIAEERNQQPRQRLVNALRSIYRMIFFKLPILSFALSSFIFLLWRRKQYDVIQVFQTQSLAYAALVAGKIAGKPVIAREAAFKGIDELDDFPMKVHIKRILVQQCNFIALSKAIYTDLTERGVATSRIAMIHNSVRSMSGLHADGTNPLSVLFVGNVLNDPLQKGLDILLQSWKSVIEKFPTACLSVVGDGDFTAFKMLARNLGIYHRVDFKGACTDIDAMYRSHQIFVLPSRFEGMSNALLEAMSAGMPCVVTRVSGSDDLIDDRINGIKVEPENISELARELKYLLAHPAEARMLGLAAQARVRTDHSPQAIALRYLGFFRTLAPQLQAFSD